MFSYRENVTNWGKCPQVMIRYFHFWLQKSTADENQKRHELPHRATCQHFRSVRKLTGGRHCTTNRLERLRSSAVHQSGATSPARNSWLEATGQQAHRASQVRMAAMPNGPVKAVKVTSQVRKYELGWQCGPDNNTHLSSNLTGMPGGYWAMPCSEYCTGEKDGGD